MECLEVKNKKLNRILKRFFIIPVPLVLLLSAIAFPLMVYCLMVTDIREYISISSYILAFYTLVVLCIRTPYMYRRSKEIIKGDEIRLIVFIRGILLKFKYSKLYIEDIEFRAWVSLYSGFAINTVYAIYRCFNGVYNKSIWFVAIGVYYFIFGLIRYMLIRRVGISKNIEDISQNKLFCIKTYKLCGILMFILNFAMAGMIIQMVWKNQVIKNYNEQEIYYFALYTFYSVIVSISNVVKFRKNRNFILSASKNLTFIGALMSMFTLQTAMLLTFDNGEVAIRDMNILTGTIIIVLSILIAIFMIIKSNNVIKKIEN